MSLNRNRKLTTLLDGKTPNNARGSGGILYTMYKSILSNVDMKLPNLMKLLNAFVTDPSNGGASNRKDQTSQMGNLIKDITKQEMTWKVFLKAIKVLGARDILFTMTITHRNGRMTEHSTKVIIDNVNLNKEEEENENEYEQ